MNLVSSSKSGSFDLAPALKEHPAVKDSDGGAFGYRRTNAITISKTKSTMMTNSSEWATPSCALSYSVRAISETARCLAKTELRQTGT